MLNRRSMHVETAARPNGHRMAAPFRSFPIVEITASSACLQAQTSRFASLRLRHPGIRFQCGHPTARRLHSCASPAPEEHRDRRSRDSTIPGKSSSLMSNPSNAIQPGTKPWLLQLQAAIPSIGSYKTRPVSNCAGPRTIRCSSCPIATVFPISIRSSIRVRAANRYY